MKNLSLWAIERQVEAMSSEIFEVGLFKPATPGAAVNEPEMLPRTWDVATLLKSVPWLKYMNAQGRNVFIRPKGEHCLSLIDDLTAASVERMNKEGFEPCVVVETSPGNFQAWLNHGRVLSKTESTAVARALAERFGADMGAADWRHFGRLAGLTNRKGKYEDDGRFPFVRLVETRHGHVYGQATGFLQRLQSAGQKHEGRATICHPMASRAALLTIDDFRTRPDYDADGNRIDLAYAVYALAHGRSPREICEAIATRDLSKKGGAARQAQYLDRTIRKAMARLGAPFPVRLTKER